MEKEYTIRKAKYNDVREIVELINRNARNGIMLARSQPEIMEWMRGFYVCEIEGRIIGCCHARIWGGNGEIEIASLVVEEEFRKYGIGKELVLNCLEEVKGLGFTDIFTLTYVPEFFYRLGFNEVPREELPQKVWTDCVKCSKYHCCDETALKLKITSTDSFK